MKILKLTLCNLIILSATMLGMQLKAQVTIGSDFDPNKGTLLDIKERNPINPAVDNSTTEKGIGMPRVKLTSMNTLIDINGGTGKEIEHTGLMVYNLSTINGFEPGIYVWDGAKWIMTKASVAAANNNWSLDGNTSTTEENHFVGTTDAKCLAFRTNNIERFRVTSSGNIGIGKTNPAHALDIVGNTLSTNIEASNLAKTKDAEVTGNLILKNTVTKTNATVLVIDNTTGQVGKASNTQAISRMIYVQSGASQTISGTGLTTLNAGYTVVVEWGMNDIVDNQYSYFHCFLHITLTPPSSK